MRFTVTLSLFWSVIACVVILGGWVVDRQDRVHTRELEIVRGKQETMRVEWRDDVKAIRVDMREILDRTPAAKTN